MYIQRGCFKNSIYNCQCRTWSGMKWLSPYWSRASQRCKWWVQTKTEHIRNTGGIHSHECRPAGRYFGCSSFHPIVVSQSDLLWKQLPSRSPNPLSHRYFSMCGKSWPRLPSVSSAPSLWTIDLRDILPVAMPLEWLWLFTSTCMFGFDPLWRPTGPRQIWFKRSRCG